MATRARTTFKKRQKELARQEKQRDKAARRMQRKLEKLSGTHEPDSDIEFPAEAESAEAPPDTESQAG